MNQKEIKELEEQLKQLRLDFNKNTAKIARKLAAIRAESEQEQQDKAADTQPRTVRSNLNEIEHEQRRSELDTNSNDDLTIGDWAEIINEYRYIEKGVQRQVRKINKSGDRVTIVDQQGKPYVRAPWNLKKVPPPRYE